MNINTSLSTTQTFGILNVRSIGDRTISSLPTDVDDTLDSNKEEQPPGLTECSFSSSESSESSNYNINNGKDSKEIVVSLVEDSKAVVSCCDEGYEIIPTTTTNNNNDKVQQTVPTTKITPPSSNKSNNNPTIEVETTSSTTPSTTSTSPVQPANVIDNDKAVEHQTTEMSKREAETSIYATLSSAAHSIRTRQISIATQPTSNAEALSSSDNVVDIDENIDGAANTCNNATQQDSLKSNTDVDALASNNDAVLDNELTISNKTQSQTKLPRVQSDTVSEYYQWYEDNVTSAAAYGNNDDDDDCSIAAESGGGCTNSTFGCTINADDFDIVDACGIFAWYMNKQVEIAAMCTPWYDDCKSDNP